MKVVPSRMSSSTPYAPFIDLFEGMFGLRGDDTDAQKYEKILAGIAAAMPGREHEIAPFIATLIRHQVDR